nr:hypothetical protein [Tanacetum cinerariifolium]
MGRDTVQLETAVNTISHEYLLDFTSEYGIPKTLHPALPGPEDRIVDFPEGWMSFSKRPGRNTPKCYTKPMDSLKNWNNRFFWVDERVFPAVVDWRTNAPKDGMPAEGTYSIEAVRVLDTHRTPIQKQPEMLLCLVGISRRYYLGDEVTNFRSLTADMDLFNLIRAPNPTKVKTGSRPRAPHEVPLLTLTAPRVIEMDEPAATDSSGVPSTIERSPLDFTHEAGASDQGAAAPEMPSSEDVPATAAPGAGQAEETTTMDPPAAPKVVIEATMGPIFAAIQLGLASTVVVPEDAPMGVSDPYPLSFVDAPSSPGIAAAGDPESENASSLAEFGSPGSVYQPEWGVTNGSLLDTPEACQDLVDHVAPPGYFSELRHMHNEEFLRQYNVNLARQVAMGSQLRLRFEQEAKLLRKSVAQVSTLQQQVFEEVKLKAAFEEFNRQQDERVEQRCAEMDARLDALSIDFDEELYPHMLTAIAGRRWVIGRGLRLAVMKYGESLELRQAFADAVSARVAKGLSEGLRHGLGHGQAQRSLESIEAYNPEAKAKFVAALQALKDLKYPLVDQLEGLRDAPMDVIMAALYLEVTLAMMPHRIYATSVPAPLSLLSRYTQRSDGVPVSAPTVVPQGLALLLADAATQTESDDT